MNRDYAVRLEPVVATGGYVIRPSYVIPAGTRDISGEVLDDGGVLRVLPAAVWAGFTPDEVRRFCHVHGVYSVPTTELVDWLRAQIRGRRAIEVGAGNGVLAAALGIPATDSRQQQDPKYAQVYADLGTPTVRYGEHVETLTAAEAVAAYRPQVVVACWVTWRFRSDRAQASGNEQGIDEERVIRVAEYLCVGNTKVHARKPALALPHTVHRAPWLVSRASRGTNIIWRWRRGAK